MKLKVPLVSDRERFSLIIQGIEHDFLKGASISIETGNWEELLPSEVSPEDVEQLKGVIASSAAGITRLILIAIAQDFASYRGFQSPHLFSILESMEEIRENIGFEAWAMDKA